MDRQRKMDSAPSTSKAGNGLGDNNRTHNILQTGLCDMKALNRFNILVAKEVIPFFAGDYKELVSFLAVVGLLNESMKPEDKPTLLDFVYFVKLSPEVRLAVSIPNKPKTFEELKNNLSRRYKELKPRNFVDKLEEELNSLTQGDMTVLEFREQLLQIHDKLAFEKLKHLKDERVKQKQLKELADEVLDRFKFGVNLPFNTRLSLCKTLDDAVETVLYLESTEELNDMNSSDEDRALIQAGFCPIGYGFPKPGKKTEPTKTQESKSTPRSQIINIPSVFSVQSCSSSNSSEMHGPTRTISLFGNKNYISVKCKNARGREPLKFFIRNTAPYSVIKFNKVFARDIHYYENTYEAPWCLGMEKIKSIGTIPLVMNLKPGVNLKFVFLVVEESDFQIHTDGMIGADFMGEHMESMYYGPKKEFVIKHRGSLFHFPIEL